MKILSLLQFIILLVVFLLLPLNSEEFDFNFGLSDGTTDGSHENKKQPSDNKEKKISKRPKFEKKFKFHKIERIYLDDYIEDNEDGGNENQEISTAADSSRTNADEEFQFERARKAIKDKRNKNSKKKYSKDTKKKDGSSEDDDDDDKQSTSFFGSLLENLFGGGSEKDESEEPSAIKGSNGKSNGLIDWLIWMGEKTGRIRPPPPPSSEQKESWLSYLDRWPFNTLFPIGKQEKPIQMPRRKNGITRRQSATADDSDENGLGIQPMSEDRFETLLHSLPSFVVNPSKVEDIECRQQLQIFQRQLRGHKLWTMQMLDATGKITSGILRGNINQFGDFDMCTQVKTMVKVIPDSPMRIRGKYCLAHIETQTDVAALKVPVHLAHGRGLWNSHLGNPGHFVPRYAVANWGICVPHSCSANVVQEMIENKLHLFNTTGVDFHVEVNDDDCVVKKNFKLFKTMKKDFHFAMTVLSLFGLTLLVTLTIASEHWLIMKSIFNFIKQKVRRSSAGSLEEKEDGEKSESTSREEKELEEQKLPSEETEGQSGKEEMAGESAEENKILEAMPLRQIVKEIFSAFSPRRTISELFSKENLDCEFPIFHVLKLFATFMLYLCLKYLMIGHLPIKNRDTLVRSVDQQFSIVFRMPIIYADILLLIAGFLAAYQLSAEMIEKSYIQLLKRVASKIVRYLPTVFVVLCIQTWILPNLDASPLWSNLIEENSRLCTQNMWRNFFNLQNAVDFEETCSPSTIQLALEVQLYALAPLIVWLYYTDNDAGFFVYGALHALSVSTRYARTNQEHLSMTLFHGMNVSKFYRSANLLYSSPISRATPYLIGIGTGLLYRIQEGSLEIAKELIPVGWITSLLSLFWCFWSPSNGMQTDYIYAAKEAAAYAAWSPLIMGLSLSWIIFMFPKNGNSVLAFLMNSRPILFLSRIAFPMQLVMFGVVLKNTAKVKESINFNIMNMISLQEIGEILFYSIMLSFLIDMPSKTVRRLLIERLFIEKPHVESEETHEDSGGHEPSESEEAHQESDGPVKKVDAGESIWASDPEEEENKYLARRRSSVIIEEASAVANDSANSHKKDEEEEEEEEEEEIDEADEVKKRPETPPPSPPAPAEKEKSIPLYRRRRMPISDE